MVIYLRRIQVLLIVVAVIAAACGGGNSESTEQPEASDAQQTTESSPEATTATTVESPPIAEPVVCHEPAPIEIGVGVTHQADNQKNGTVCFWVEVPEGLASVSFNLDGLSGNLNLAVGFGFARTLLYNVGEFWASRNAETNPESIEITDPNAGPYFIKVGPAGSGQQSTFSLLVSTTPESTTEPTGQPLPDIDQCGGPATVLSVGESASGEILEGQTDILPRAYFCIEVPAGQTPFLVELSGLTSHLDLFVLPNGTGEFLSDRSRGGETRSVAVDAPQATAYYIEVAAALPGAASEFTIKISG